MVIMCLKIFRFQDNLNQRVAALKNAYLTPKKRQEVAMGMRNCKNFEKDLMRLIDIEEVRDYFHGNVLLFPWQLNHLSFQPLTPPQPPPSLPPRKSTNDSRSLPPSPWQPQPPLETRVAMLEAQLAEETKTKLQLKKSFDQLLAENRKLMEEHEGNKKEVEKLKKLLIGE